MSLARVLSRLGLAGRRYRFSWLPGAATLLAIVSCYGTLLFIGLLSVIGISLAVDERAWAGAIGLSAGFAAACIGLSGWRKRVVGPTAVALLGLTVILWTMAGAYDRAVELAGFALLAAAAVWDLRSRPLCRDAEGGVSWIDAPDLARRLQGRPRPVVVDVRGADEFTGELGHIEGALSLPFDDLAQRQVELDRFKAEELVLVCKTQIRSAKAWAMLTDAGFRHVAVLRGGMVEWVRQGRAAGFGDG
jgi:rhodanese-related sulfurtransferase